LGEWTARICGGGGVVVDVVVCWKGSVALAVVRRGLDIDGSIAAILECLGAFAYDTR